MGAFEKRPDIKEIRQTTGAAIGAMGSSVIPCRLELDRFGGRRVEKIELHVNITTTGTITTAAGKDGLEGIFREVRVRVSDAAGSERFAIKANSTSLLNRCRFLNGDLDRHTKAAWGMQATAGTYDLVIPVYFRNPLLSEFVGPKFALPLDPAFVTGNPVVEIDVGTLNDVGIASTTGAFTINYIRSSIEYVDGVPSDGSVPYIPTQFVSYDIWNSGAPSGEQEWSLPEDGQLAAIQVEEFSAASTRGYALSQSGLFGLWQFAYNGTVRRQGYSKLLEAMNDRWMKTVRQGDSGTVDAANPVATWEWDFFNDSDQGSAGSPGSTYSLYIAASGQRGKLRTTNLAANGWARVSTYKLMSQNLAALVGA